MNYLYYEEFFSSITGKIARTTTSTVDEKELLNLGYDAYTLQQLNEKKQYDDAIGQNRWCHIWVAAPEV